MVRSKGVVLRALIKTEKFQVNAVETKTRRCDKRWPVSWQKSCFGESLERITRRNSNLNTIQPTSGGTWLWEPRIYEVQLANAICGMEHDHEKYADKRSVLQISDEDFTSIHAASLAATPINCIQEASLINLVSQQVKYKRDQIHTCQQQWTEAKQCILNVVSAIPSHTNAPSALGGSISTIRRFEMRRGKELGKKSAKRRLLFEEIPRTSPNRRHDGVKRIFKVFLKIVIRNVVSCIEHAKRKAIMAMNIVNVLKRKLYVGGG
ncbi:hypothetical protein pipiens_008048 [Culex pipiens pipiens]|uniref:Uncharacterized protein n=1 Tax=Culex pipiens pipiens TaxID=38569 RepID=A0ABD1DK74_CULPP